MAEMTPYCIYWMLQSKTGGNWHTFDIPSQSSCLKETFTVVYHKFEKMQEKTRKKDKFVKNISNGKFTGSMVYLDETIMHGKRDLGGRLRRGLECCERYVQSVTM